MFGMLKNAIYNLFRGPYTLPYPAEVRPPVPGSRGSLDMDPVACIYCGQCARRCPTKAITVDRAAKEWRLEAGRCIICGYCVQVCPKKCMWLNPEHGLAKDCTPMKPKK